jgi:hypothetical protein
MLAQSWTQTARPLFICANNYNIRIQIAKAPKNNGLHAIVTPA